MTITIPAWIAWFIVLTAVLNIIGTIVEIDVPREPVSRGGAAFFTLAWLCLIGMLLLGMYR